MMSRTGEAMSPGERAAVATWVEQRLEEVVVLHVDDGEIDIRVAAKRQGGAETAETGAQDDDAWS